MLWPLLGVWIDGKWLKGAPSKEKSDWYRVFLSSKAKSSPVRLFTLLGEIHCLSVDTWPKMFAFVYDMWVFCALRVWSVRFGSVRLVVHIYFVGITNRCCRRRRTCCNCRRSDLHSCSWWRSTAGRRNTRGCLWFSIRDKIGWSTRSGDLTRLCREWRL